MVFKAGVAVDEDANTTAGNVSMLDVRSRSEKKDDFTKMFHQNQFHVKLAYQKMSNQLKSKCFLELELFPSGIRVWRPMEQW